MVSQWSFVPTKGYDPVIARISKRTTKHADLDAIIGMVGARGSTKSGCSISIGNRLDPNFHLPASYLPEGFKLKPNEIMPRVVFTPSHFLRLITEEDLPRGSCIVLDEIGVIGDSREFMSVKNKMLKQTMETIRSRNLIIFLTAPTLASFDISFRRSMNFYFRCKGRGRNELGKRCGLTQPYYVTVDPRDGEIFLNGFKWRDPITGLITYLSTYKVSAPPKYMWKPYSRLKKYMQHKLYEGFYKEMQVADNYFNGMARGTGSGRSGIEEQTLDDFVAIVSQTPEKYIDLKTNKVVKAALINGLKLNDKKASDLKSVLELKLRNKELVLRD